MTASDTPPEPLPAPVPALTAPLRAAGLALAVGLFAIVAVIAIGSGLGSIALPFEMWLLDQKMPLIFRLHMVTSGAALLLFPVILALRHRPQLHRKFGWLLGAFVVAGGLTALPVAIFSNSSLAARAGFFVQGLVWLALLGAAIVAIRKGDRARHAFLMLAMCAVTTGAVWFRVMTGAAIALDGPFDAVYAAAAWLGWILPLALVVALRARLMRWAFQPAAPRTHRSVARPLAAGTPIV